MSPPGPAMGRSDANRGSFMLRGGRQAADGGTQIGAGSYPGLMNTASSANGLFTEFDLSHDLPAPAERAEGPLANFRFDGDHGGSVVGGRIKNLDLVSSRLDGSVSGADAIAYLEWTFELRNTGLLDRESRLQVALPPGGVVSRATLWVNGEEREAAYGGRGEVRAAYTKVAVQQRRDPLLVTTKGADRVLAQAFPVPRGGGKRWASRTRGRRRRNRGQRRTTSRCRLPGNRRRCRRRRALRRGV